MPVQSLRFFPRTSNMGEDGALFWPSCDLLVSRAGCMKGKSEEVDKKKK